MKIEYRQALTDAIHQVQAGGIKREAGLAALFNLLWKKTVIRYVAAGLPADQAEDVAGAFMLKLVEKSHLMRDPIAAELWLVTIRANTLTDYFRNRANTPEISLGSQDEDVFDDQSEIEILSNRYPVIDIVKQRCLNEQLEVFATEYPQRAHVLLLVAENDFDSRQLGQAIGRTEGAAKVFLSDCRKKLSAYLKPCLE